MEERGVDQEAGSKGGKLEFTVSGVDWDKSEGMAKADEKKRQTHGTFLMDFTHISRMQEKNPNMA